MRQSVFQLIILSCSYSVCSGCQPGWSRYKNSCYGVTKAKMSWEEAQGVCVGFSGHLVEIETEGESAFIKGLISASGSGGYNWIGSTDLFDADLDPLRWTTTGHQNTILNQPLVMEDGVPPICYQLGLNDYDDARIFSETCNSRAAFICEIEKQQEMDYCSP